ncbi:MAG: hypothetical protein NWQ27_02400 [Crocinitomicaceae bacterium]|nr:hypothetical protein [Crocinitomicaceae bacterium]
MKLTLLLILFSSCLSMSSCTSEYEERLKEAKSLKVRLTSLESDTRMYSEEESSIEEEEIYNKIHMLARLSGNEQLFLKEVFSN